MNLEEEAVESPTRNILPEFVEVLRNLIHQLSQPLTSLRGSLELALLGEVKEPECRKILQQSFEESLRLAAGLTTLREVLEAEDRGEDFQRVNWKRLVRKALKDVAPAARGKGLQLVLEPLADAYVKVNPPRVEAGLRELFRQLIRRGPQGRALRIGLSVQEGTASLLVCDEGLGSKAEASAAATPPASNSAEEMQRTELAWWILRRSIEVQGGRLEMENISSRGVRCRVSLPLASSENRGHDSR
jgi:signal transduction histidine kinase